MYYKILNIDGFHKKNDECSMHLLNVKYKQKLHRHITQNQLLSESKMNLLWDTSVNGGIMH